MDNDIKASICHEWGHALMMYLLGYADNIREIVVTNEDAYFTFRPPENMYGSYDIFINLAGTGAEKVCGYRETFALYGINQENSDLNKIYKVTTDANVIWEHKKWVEETLVQYKEALNILVEETLLYYVAERTKDSISIRVPKEDVLMCIEWAIGEAEDKMYAEWIDEYAKGM